MSGIAVGSGPVGGSVRPALRLEVPEPEILLPLEKCLIFDVVKVEDKLIEVPVGIDISCTADEVRKIIPLITMEETGSILYYREGVYVEGGEAKVDALLHKSFHGFGFFHTISTPKQIIAHLKGLTMVSKDKFDANLDIINMKNGLYDWRKGILYSHTPDYPSQVQIPVNYNPDADCKLILSELRLVISPDDVMKFLEFAGYCLYRQYPIQKAFILLGPGRTGKSCVLDVLRRFVGDANSCSVSLSNLANNRFAGSDLFGKMLDVVNEMDSGELLSSDLFKQITGGSKDPIRAERKYEHSFNFINFAKLAFATNKLPKTRDDTTGFHRRFEIIRCDHVFAAEDYNAEILDHLTDPEELSGFFNLVICMLPELLERRAFTDEMTPEQVKEIWEANSVPIVDFADRFIDTHAADQDIPKEALYQRFLEYCRLVGTTEAEWTIRKFNSELKKTIPEFINLRHDTTCKVEGKGCKVWYDTRFKEDEFKAFKKEVEKEVRKSKKT
jgi:putative DNA primase/helicase